MLDTAEDLFLALSPATGDLWRFNDHVDKNRDWIFRGQANGEDGAHWGLRPSAHREPDAFLRFIDAIATAHQLTGVELREVELTYIIKFAEIVDNQGLAVPFDSHELRDTRIGSRDPADRPLLNPKLFPHPSLVALAGLAQHHGIPTRLLDWTIKPLVAAYFAAEPVAARRCPGRRPAETEHKYFSVFALSRFAVTACVNLDPEIHILTVPTVTNANLHAQGGQFTLVQPLSDPGETPLPAIDEVLQKHADEIGVRAQSQWSNQLPLLIEFCTPVGEARTVMATLKSIGVTGASIYPGLGGVVKAMEEARFYQFTKPGERS